MSQEFDATFGALCGAFAPERKRLTALKETPEELRLHTLMPSPLPQYKGAPMFFGSVRKGKAYVSFHFFPLYMCAELKKGLSPELKKRMQGKTCFNFKTVPEAALLKELKALTKAGMKAFKEKGWA